MENSSLNLEGKIALITGSSRGLGLVFARGLSKAGAKIVINGRNGEQLEETRTALSREGSDVSAYSFDISDEKAVENNVEAIENQVGPIDILINNAGLQHRTELQDFPEEKWRSILETNLTGAFIVSKYVVRHMIPRTRGKIVNICSLQSDLGRNTIAPYAASKGGLKMLTRGMAVDWAKYNIQVNAIGPGYFVTEMTQALKDDPNFDTWLCKRTPASRWGDPHELIGTLLFFCSEASDFVNGQLLYVDGGISAAI